MKQKILCFLFGHKDPVMEFADVTPKDDLYHTWKTEVRNCMRCNKVIDHRI